ncbi:20641_t:CDS:2, partial [Gigaspora margarita]
PMPIPEEKKQEQEKLAKNNKHNKDTYQIQSQLQKKSEETNEATEKKEKGINNMAHKQQFPKSEEDKQNYRKKKKSIKEKRRGQAKLPIPEKERKGKETL